MGKIFLLMENQLIQLYFLSKSLQYLLPNLFQRLSNNRKPDFTEQKLACICFSGNILIGLSANCVSQLKASLINHWC